MKTLTHSKTSRSKTNPSRHVAVSRSIFTEIKKEHAEFRKAMKRITRVYERDPETAKIAYLDFQIRLRAHADAEEATLYPYLLEKTVVGTKLDDQVREGVEEHHLGNLLANELDQISPGDPKWKAKFRVLTESVEHHLDEEEDYFKRWRRFLSPSEDRLVHDRFLAARESNRKRALMAH
ncbi:MAG: hemerythrin domain-containing protein [Bdellovibrionales bacterium]|nr:hemerythrin domain-containing protein [Bdellovibrionales bacterium]